ncbi:hypothetical protein OKW96_14835 [Sphingobacterium sp. KU25419]|nr:hypothetical protein OKW96_14835 [Sphingobacterium sp. KU25419]
MKKQILLFASLLFSRLAVDRERKLKPILRTAKLRKSIMLMIMGKQLGMQKYILAMESCQVLANIKTERKSEKESGIGKMEN